MLPGMRVLRSAARWAGLPSVNPNVRASNHLQPPNRAQDGAAFRYDGLTERQVTAAITSCRSVQHLRKIVLPACDRLNGIHVCCALSQLALIASRAPRPGHAAASASSSTAGAAADASAGSAPDPAEADPGSSGSGDGAAHAQQPCKQQTAPPGQACRQHHQQLHLARATADALATRLVALLPLLRPREVSTLLYSW